MTSNAKRKATTQTKTTRIKSQVKKTRKKGSKICSTYQCLRLAIIIGIEISCLFLIILVYKTKEERPTKTTEEIRIDLPSQLRQKRKHKLDKYWTRTRNTSISKTLYNYDKKRQKLQTILDRNFIETGSVFRRELLSDFTTSSNLQQQQQNQSSIYLWDYSELVPSWMKQYFRWHTRQRQFLNKYNWKHYRFIVMSCLDGIDDKCGGTADRLKSILYILQNAYKLKRILIIHWTTPMKLEEFLLPPIGGIDWRAPSWFEPILRNNVTNGVRIISGRRLEDYGEMLYTNEPIIRTRYQSYTGGEGRYEKMRRDSKANNANTIVGSSNDLEELGFSDVYHDAWRIFFTPSKPVAAIIQKEMKRMKLRRGEYAAAHVRALYGPNIERSKEETIEWTQNALNCASNLRPDGPIYFASEHTYATQVALQYNEVVHKRYGSTTRIVSRIHSTKPPLHFEKMEMGGVERKTDPSNLQPSDLYETFVDLYLLGMSSCLTYNRGGFGTWASLIGYNPYCIINQKTSTDGIGNRCNWTEPQSTRILEVQSATSNTDADTLVIPPLFLEPMIDSDVRNDDNIEKNPAQTMKDDMEKNVSKTANKDIEKNITLPTNDGFEDDGLDDGEIEYRSIIVYNDKTTIMNTSDYGRHARPRQQPLPTWMTNYMQWHNQVRQNLTRTNWNSTKYLVMTCLKDDNKCGGISDRIKPLPFVLLNAYRSKRLLLIFWERPMPLEEYFEPPPAQQSERQGYNIKNTANNNDQTLRVNWLVPEWLKRKLRRGLNRRSGGIVAMIATELPDRIRENPERLFIGSRLQSPDGAAGLYEENTKEEIGEVSTYESVFHLLFRSFFVPTERLQERLDKIQTVGQRQRQNSFQLISGQYASAHLRAMYGNRKWRDPYETVKLTINAINCASQLKPGGPVYFAADIRLSLEIAEEYAKQRNVPVTTILQIYDNNDENSKSSNDNDDDDHVNDTYNVSTIIGNNGRDPLHFDKDSDWRGRDPSDYDDTFIDLYMLGESLCVAYSNGGFGTFGQALSYNPECFVRHFRIRKIFSKCTSWIDSDGISHKYKYPKLNLTGKVNSISTSNEIKSTTKTAATEQRVDDNKQEEVQKNEEGQDVPSFILKLEDAKEELKKMNK